jgi:plastocyanin
VIPYLFKNEKGRLAINVPVASLSEITQGKAAAITGTATTSGKGGASRPITATATPAGSNAGIISLSFMAGTRKMVFDPAYHFADKGTQAAVAPTSTNHAALSAAIKHP